MSLSALLLAGANLLPLLGVVFWGWDVFVLLVLYWLETLVIAFWTIFQVVTMPDASRKQLAGNNGKALSRIGSGLFFTLHAGVFMAVHFMFLWSMFSGDWPQRISSPGDFWRELVVGADIWIPLAFLFLVRGWMVLGNPVLARLGFVEEAPPPVQNSVVSGLYGRIMVMQFAILFGGWVAVMLNGSVGVLVVLVVMKMVVELFYDPMRAPGPEADDKDMTAV